MYFSDFLPGEKILEGEVCNINLFPPATSIKPHAMNTLSANGYKP